MFDLGAAELLVIVIVAIIVIGPKDMPMALRTAGRWMGKVRRVSGHFRSGLDTMIREAELEDMEKKWKEQNEAIMAKAPSVSAEAATGEEDCSADWDGEMTGPPAHPEQSVPDSSDAPDAVDASDNAAPRDDQAAPKE